MKHWLEKHQRCRREHCIVCDGGLGHCIACDGWEGELPTDCPLERMTQPQMDRVYAGYVDFSDQRGWHLTVELIGGPEDGGVIELGPDWSYPDLYVPRRPKVSPWSSAAKPSLYDRMLVDLYTWTPRARYWAPTRRIRVFHQGVR